MLAIFCLFIAKWSNDVRKIVAHSLVLQGQQSYELCRKVVRQENVQVDIDKQVDTEAQCITSRVSI